MFCVLCKSDAGIEKRKQLGLLSQKRKMLCPSQLKDDFKETNTCKLINHKLVNV